MAEQTRHELNSHHSVTEFIECAEVSEIPDDGVIAVNLAGQPIALAKSDGKIFAVDNRCPHMGYPLNRGSVHDGILICHWHHAISRRMHRRHGRAGRRRTSHSVYIAVKICLQTIRMKRWINWLQLHSTRTFLLFESRKRCPCVS